MKLISAEAHKKVNRTNLYTDIRHFEGLNALRFLAAFLVVISHAESIRKKNGLFHFEWLGFFRNGGTGVTFFFVLSGFLITYLLLKERHFTRTTRIRNFYINRMLRIWPLYFLMVGFGTLVLPLLIGWFGFRYEMPYTLDQVWHYFLFFLPGLVTFYYGHHFLEPLWSIGVEEVFYLFWAPLFRGLRNRIVYLLVLIIITKMMLLAAGQVYAFSSLFIYLLSTFQFEAMAVGGLGAWFVFHSNKPLSDLKIYRKGPQLLIYAALLAHLCFHSSLNLEGSGWEFLLAPLMTVLLQGIFLYLIIGISLVDHNLIRLRYRFLSFLGEISYGIYMYQLLAISITIVLLRRFLEQLDGFTGTLLFYGTLLPVLILISFLSKRYFEDFFLKYKKHYSRLKPEGT